MMGASRHAGWCGTQVNVTQANNTSLGHQTVTFGPWDDTSTSGTVSGESSITSPSLPYNSTPYEDYDWCQAQTNTNVTTDPGATGSVSCMHCMSRSQHAVCNGMHDGGCWRCQGLRSHGSCSISMGQQTPPALGRASGTPALSAAMPWTHARRCQTAPTPPTSSVPSEVSRSRTHAIGLVCFAAACNEACHSNTYHCKPLMRGHPWGVLCCRRPLAQPHCALGRLQLQLHVQWHVHQWLERRYLLPVCERPASHVLLFTACPASPDALAYCRLAWCMR